MKDIIYHWKIDISKVKNLLNEIDLKKEVHVDKIFTTLIKISSDIIVKPPAIVINNCLTQGIFPKNAKIDSCTSVDMSYSSKREILNYWPANIFNLFSKNGKSEVQDKRIYFSIKRFSFFFQFIGNGLVKRLLHYFSWFSNWQISNI